MQLRAVVTSTLLLLLAPAALAKDTEKNKSLFPGYILQAHTVCVLIDPDAGFSVKDPQANETARRDVETALINWHRFQLVMDCRNADLIVEIRKGTGKLTATDIGDPRQNRRPGYIDPTDTGGIAAGGQRGPSGKVFDPMAAPTSSSSGNSGPVSEGGPHPQTEIGNTDDSFLVFEGQLEDPLDSPPGWKIRKADALKSHSVPAVDAFRKAVQEAEKAAATKP